MTKVTKQFKVFVASPGDVSIERNIIPKIVAEINLIISAIAPEKKLLLDLIRWETHVHPGLGIDAQSVVNEQLPDYDIFIGIMWKRFGTPTSRYGSGTEEEFWKAYGKWKTNNKFPVLFYFSQKNMTIPNSLEEIEQLKKVVAFREELLSKGLIWEYTSPEEFGDILRPHLIMTLSKLVNDTLPLETVNDPQGKTLTESDLGLIRNRVEELKKDYKKANQVIDSRAVTRSLLSVIESKMRSMALDLVPLLPELTKSDSEAERLAAISTLKEIPIKQYFDWLATRVGQAESNFVGLHASIALLNASKKYKGSDMISPIQQAIENLNNSPYKDRNQVSALTQALQNARE